MGQELVFIVLELLSSGQPVLAWWAWWPLMVLSSLFSVTLCCSCQPRVLTGPSLEVCPGLAWSTARLRARLACPLRSLPARSGSTAGSTSRLWRPCSPLCGREEKAAVRQLEQETGLL